VLLSRLVISVSSMVLVMMVLIGICEWVCGLWFSLLLGVC